MRKGTIFKTYELFVAAGVIGAHASAASEGFRQRDVRFLIELFTNWVEETFPGPVLELSNAQVQRYLDQLVDEGFARRLSRGKLPHYRLSRTGLIELLGRIIPESFCAQPQYFFFAYYFMISYRPRLEKLVSDEGKQFPLALKLELEALLDEKGLVKTQIQMAERELKKLEGRIADAVRAGTLARQLYARNVPTLEVASEVEKHYPYDLNSQKPLRELISAVPEDLAKWELQVGGEKRTEYLWKPGREVLQSYIQVLRKLIA